MMTESARVVVDWPACFQKLRRMRLWQLQWSACLVVTLIIADVQAVSASLSEVQQIALDRNRPLSIAGTVKAIHAQLDNRNAVWIQLWQPATSDGQQFTLYWQKELKPHYGNGSKEVIDLEVREYTEINESLRIGIMNSAIPGPVDGVFRSKGSVVLSLKKETSRTVHRGQRLQFDGLLYPYNLPIVLCNETGCPHLNAAYRKKVSVPSTAAPAIISAAKNENLLTRGMIIGLIAWNALVSFFLLIVIICLIVVCIEMDDEKEKRDRTHASAAVREIYTIPYGDKSAPSEWMFAAEVYPDTPQMAPRKPV